MTKTAARIGIYMCEPCSDHIHLELPDEQDEVIATASLSQEGADELAERFGTRGPRCAGTPRMNARSTNQPASSGG